MKIQVLNWEKYLKITYDRRFVSKVYKELLKFNNMKINIQLKMGRKSEQIASPEKSRWQIFI